METRKLGDSTLAITPLLGGNVLGWTADDRRRSQCSTRSSNGGNSLDTADAYSAWRRVTKARARR